MVSKTGLNKIIPIRGRKPSQGGGGIQASIAGGLNKIIPIRGRKPDNMIVSVTLELPLKPDIYILPSLLVPYFLRMPSADLKSYVIILSGGDAMDNSFLHRKKLLLVDDEPDLLKMVSDILSDAGFETVLTAATVKEAIITAEKEKPDLMVLDVMLPDGDGFSLMKQLRTFTNVPIIFLTAKDEAADKLAGLGLGADDYISKPFMPQELLLRVYAVLRRTYKEDSPRVFLDGCTIDFSRAEVNKGGEIIPLTAKEHTLLETLARNEGKIVTVDALCEALWGDNPFGYENSLNAHVRRIREKIEADPSKPVSLITIKGLGYKLITRK